MRNIYITSFLTCFVILSCIYAPQVQAGKNEQERDIKGEYIIKYDISHNERIVNEDNKQVAFRINERKTVSNEMLSKDEIGVNIKEFAGKVIDVSKYVLEDMTYYEESKYYTATFYKYKDGYKTQDFCFVDLDVYGNVLSYAAMNQGTFDNVDLSVVKEEKIQDYVINYINSEFNHEVWHWSIADVIAVTNEKSEPQMMIFIDLEFMDGTYFSDTITMKIEQ